jgi:hypothetical protein
MSSDLCSFVSPTFGMTGADKIQTGATATDHYIHIIDTGTTIDLIFTFTGSVETFTADTATFKYGIYKFNNASNVFVTPAVVQSDTIEFSSFSATSAFTATTLVSDLNIDGEYLVKGSFDFVACTTLLNQLGITIDTNVPLLGTSYGLYDDDFDYYFAAIERALEPIFQLSPTDTRTLGALTVESFILSGETFIELNSTWSGNVIVALNGLTLSEEDDFTTANNNTIYFLAPTIADDILTVAYVNSGNPNGLLSESIIVPTPIISGATDGEGDELAYYNTGTSKYEIYMLATPIEFNDVIVTLNGVTLANGLDYAQSATNTKRIILEGVIIPDDIITITYNSYGTYIGTILVDNFDLYWTITPAPPNDNGLFTAYVAEDDTFATIIFSATTPYVTNESSYNVNIDLSGYTGTTAVYKVSNQKDYELISGGTISTITDSEIIPITIEI